MRKLFFCAVLLVSAIPMLLTSTATWAQTNTGVITGTVTDQSGAVIPNAQVVITSQSTNAPLTFTTNAQGYFTSVPINPDTYSVAVTAQGFQPQTQAGIVLRVQDRLNLNFKMSVGSVSNRVVVTGQTPVVDTQTSSLGQVVSAQQITALPLNGRNYLSLAGLSTGVIQISSPGSNTASDGLVGGGTGPLAVDFVSNGSRGDIQNYLLDGVDNNSNDNGGPVILTQPDALQEFKIQTSSFSAQFGRSGGAVINAITKSGTNSYHGTIFEFLRNSALDARDYFTTPAVGPKAPFKQNEYGGTLGGFIVKNKLFWFGDWEGINIRSYRTRFATVPTSTAEITGDFTGGPTIYDPTHTTCSGGVCTRPSFQSEYGSNKIPTGMIDPIGQAFLNLYPAPNIPGVAHNNFVAPNIPLPYDQMQGDFRGDWDPSEKDQAFIRYSQVGFTRNQGQIFPGIAQGQSGSDQGESQMGAALGETHIFSPTVVNEFRLGFSWYADYQEVPPFGIHFPPPELTIPGLQLFANTAGVAQFNPATYRGLGMGGYDPTYLATEERQVSDSLSWTRGKHSMVAGFEMRWSEFNIFQVPNPNGQLNFSGNFTSDPATGDGGSSLADALLGWTSSATYNTQVEVQNRQYIPSAFFQDDWRVTPTFTLNLGIRYDYFSPIVGKHDVQANFNYATQQIEVAGGHCPTAATFCTNSGSRGLVKVDHFNFSPRIGFAKTFNKNTVVSAGGGIFWTGQEIKTAGPLQLAYNLPFYYQPQFTSSPLSSGTSLITLTGGFPPSSPSQAINPGVTSLGGTPTNTGNFLSTPSYLEYNVSVQQALPGRLSLELSGAGSKGTHLQAILDYNQLKAPTSQDNIQPLRPYPQYGPFTSMVNSANSTYYSFQAKLEDHATQGLYFLNSFTWGKAYDSQPNLAYTGPPQNSWNVPSEYGLADFNQSLRWVFSYDYLLPFGRGQKYGSGINSALNQVISGWHLGGIYSLGSGFPFTVTMSNDLSNTGSQGTPRPDQILADGNYSRSKRNVNNWFNVAAYADAAPFTFGDAGRNTLIGPDVNNWDLSLRKTFPIHEAMNVEFRSEFFNFLNHPNFAQPDSNIDDGNPLDPIPGSASTITGTAGANRQIQLALKFNF